jgi:Kef-type K+ transport system membrane component KefB
MIGIALLLAAAAVGHGLARLLRLPSIPFLLLGGVALRIAGFLPPQRLLEFMIVLGLSVLVFVGGTELNPRRVRTQRRAALGVGVAQFTVLGAAGFLATLAFGYGVQVALYVALAVSASSTLVVVRLLQQRLQLFEPFGRLVIGVLLLQDLFVILAIPVVVRYDAGVAAIAGGLAGALALMALSFGVLRWVAPWLLARLHGDDERLLLAILSILFVFVGIADMLDLPIIAGAFLAGVSLSTFPAAGLVRGQLNSIADFFTAIFFTALGVLLAVPTLFELVHVLTLTAIVLLITPPLVTAVAERYGLSARQSLESGLLLAQTSEFSLVVALQGLVLGQLGQGTFTVIALLTAITMMLTPLSSTDRVTLWLLRFHPLRRAPGERTAPRDHVLLLGCGENGMPLLETLYAAGTEVFVVDDDPAIIRQLREGEIPCVRGDGSDPDVLRRAGARDARLIISTIRRPLDNEQVLQHAQGVPVLVRVFEDGDADRIRALGGTPIVYSAAAAEDFLAWYTSAASVGVDRERRMRSR